MTDDHDDALERLLRLVPYFRDLDRVSLARFAGALESIDVTAGTEIIREGTEAHELSRASNSRRGRRFHDQSLRRCAHIRCYATPHNWPLYLPSGRAQ